MEIKVNKRWLDLLSKYIANGEYNKATTMIESFLLLTDVYEIEIYNVPFSLDFTEWSSYYSYFKRKFYK